MRGQRTKVDTTDKIEQCLAVLLAQTSLQGPFRLLGQFAAQGGSKGRLDLLLGCVAEIVKFAYVQRRHEAFDLVGCEVIRSRRFCMPSREPRQQDVAGYADADCSNSKCQHTGIDENTPDSHLHSRSPLSYPP